jgi:DNA-binding CsgD family transcriptional regulator
VAAVADGWASRVVSPIMVGRDEELARLANAVRMSPSVVVVEGEAGMGKTRLVAELFAHPDVAARSAVSGACRPIREPFPLGPIVEAMRGSGDRLVDAALSPVAGALRGLLPELVDVLPPALQPLEDRAAERHRSFRGLAELITALADVVLVVEDLHWADEQTLEFLTWLLGNPPAGLSVVLTYRSEQTPAQVRAVTARPADRMAVEHITVEPLGVAQTRSLASVILGMEPPPVSEAFAAYLCERSSGSPLAIQELLALLRERGELIRWEGGWARRTLDALDVPAGVRDPVRERVQRLAEPARAVAEAAAVLGEAVPVAVLAEVSGQAGRAVDDGLESGLLAAANGAVGFRHVLAAQAVYEGIPPARCQQLHARAATAVNGMRPVPIGRLAHHLRHAGQDAGWVDAVERAAEQATSLGDHTEAARLLEDVLRHAELPPKRRAALTVRLGWIAAEVLHIADFADLVEQALEAELPRVVRGELRFVLATYLDKDRTKPERRRRLLAEAVADLEERPDLAAWATTALGLPSAPLLPVEEHLLWLEQALPLLPQVTDHGVRLLLLGKIAAVFSTVGDARWVELTRRLESGTGGRPRQGRELSAYISVGINACMSGHHRESRRLFTAALAGITAPEEAGDLALRCRGGLAFNAYCRGEWDGLDEEVSALLGLTRRPADAVTAETLFACLTLSRGDLDGSAERLHGVIVRALHSGDFDLLPVAVTALLRLATARGEAVAGVAATVDAVAACELTGAWPVMVRAIPALTEALRAAGRADEAAAVVERYADRLRDLDAPLAAPALTHARAVLADGRESADLFDEASNGYRKLPATYEAAQADEGAAARLFAVGDEAAAARALHAAITKYTALGARWDLDRATRAARKRGLRVPTRRREVRAEPLLTGRQAEVAKLAAAGLTNKQIGQELFLSPKTVDKHVGAALRKLGLHSRTELTGWMGRAARD